MIKTLDSAIEAVGGITAASKICGISYVAISKWLKRGRLPRTEYSGETKYSEALAQASGGRFSAADLRRVGKPEQAAA